MIVGAKRLIGSVAQRYRAGCVKTGLPLALTGAALAISVLTVAPASAADRVIATAPVTAYPPEPLLSPVDAYGGNLVWGQNSLRGFDYFVRDARGTRRLLPGMHPMDLDLGARRGGGTQAVLTGGARYGSDLFSYDFRSGATRRLSSLTRPVGFEGSPSVWKGRFAFVRMDEFDLPSNAPPRRLGLFATSPLRTVTRTTTVATDLRGSRLAYVTSKGRTTTLYVATLPRGRARARSCFVARATDFPGGRPKIALSNPVFTSTHVYWRRKDARASGATIRRRRLPRRGCRSGGREQRSRELSAMQSFATARGRFFYTTRNQVREATDPRLTFSR